MISLDKVLALSTKIPGIYTELELSKLYELAVELPDHATVVEIGVLYGRSASVFFQVAQHKPLRLHFIDPWVVSEGDTFKYFTGMVDQHFRNVPFTLISMTSFAARGHLYWQDLLHVDGDHSPEGIDADCLWWASGMPKGGHAVFHDYDTRAYSATGAKTALVFPQIKETVDRYCADWEKVGVFDTQAIFRRAR